MAFKRMYINNKNEIGFEREDATWLIAHINGDEVHIDKAYMDSEPSLSVKQARKFADKIIGFCNKIDKKGG